MIKFKKWLSLSHFLDTEITNAKHLHKILTIVVLELISGVHFV